MYASECGMTDEYGPVKASKNKGRSASICVYSSRSDRDCVAAAAVGGDYVNISTSSIQTTTATTSLTSDDNRSVRKPASRSQSVRLTGGKSLRRRAHHADDGHRSPLGAGISEPKLNSYEFSASEARSTGSPGSSRLEGSVRPVNSVHNFRSHRKSAAFLDIPKSQPTDQQVDVDSYRLRSFSFTTKGLVNRGDSFRKRHDRRNTIILPHEPKIDDVQRQETHGTTSADKTNNWSGSGLVTYNVFVIGATNVGKTSLINQFMTSECINPYDRERDEPSQQTISIMLNGEESELCFHELKHLKIVQKKCAADAFLILYSVVDKSTFQYAETELEKLHDSNVLFNKPAILVANKIDLARSRTVSSQDGKCLACTFRVKHIEISVGINHNVDELLVGVLDQIRLRKQRHEQESLAQPQHHQLQNQHRHHWYKNRAVIRASMKARQMFTWIFGREDSKFKNCENLHAL